MFGDALTEFGEASANDMARLLRTAADSVAKSLVTRLNDGGYPTVRASQLPVFATLDPEGTHVSVMAKRAGISRQAMSALVKDVEREGFVSTSADPNDGRAIVVSLTETGAAFCRAAIDTSRQINEEIADSIGSDALDQLREALRSIATP